ncbi:MULTISPECIES: STAS domain-containing protein [Pseudomonas]|jgi:rsbT co-antagonist protein RsbR|uniref:STAS domain-containing protein n=1 Tax=Pseudomonas rhodesiae TaxID=76760 RepID=A0A8I1E2P9_9PSED|nr:MULTISPECIES: STAS domain-containing protein [Pseudomonas]OXS23205.1 polyvinylalcohol dehydrogenase [Pseudomonas fluorescens]MBB4812891.1 rsbT co-antagonist protein RsbR [Pseudomonas rhodesiae]MBI6599607.1 STAS domain-containing protein [Pseudomonas sp. S4_EA_1b]MBI6623859.1 STAS domain-containing protein [Pseudomonas rhodesiae]MBX4135938.1 STAS domain-containing protein [Pseudomonas sp. S5F11]
MATLHATTVQALQSNKLSLLTTWIESLEASGATRNVKEADLKQQANDFLNTLIAALEQGGSQNVNQENWAETRVLLEKLSHSRALVGQDSQQTASFIFALKGPLFALLQREYAEQPAQLAEQLWEISELLDALGMHTIRTFQKSRELVIKRQQEELLELSTPVVKLWDGVLALPMIGTLDSQRTQVVMESLLQRIVDTGAEIAIIDITGVPTVDTLVAQHLLKTVTAIRLMGADCIISGVRPQIAQTIVHLGLDLQGVVTKANLADALALSLKRLGVTVTKAV